MPFSVTLCEPGVDASEPSLIAALKNSNPEVRSLAAAELAEKHEDLAKPAIENALSAETNTRARIDIAASLVSMSDPVGAKTGISTAVLLHMNVWRESEDLTLLSPVVLSRDQLFPSGPKSGSIQIGFFVLQSKQSSYLRKQPQPRRAARREDDASRDDQLNFGPGG
ncbi:hypothetical protein BDD14_4702 [Edaphobacter modestus]|uniref:HEAT repeat protein n=1 Tax=Edaphobacter modestus TaxID=388466 RepID=A0A4Q7YYL9_9BACT|nr:hypothetical protein BDD14_4702 [Edaphobacter modestus]